jgi:hypothetical protein
VTEWACAHAALGGSNLAGSRLWLLDWEDWGMTPRGTHTARPWLASLTTRPSPGRSPPALALTSPLVPATARMSQGWVKSGCAR